MEPNESTPALEELLISRGFLSPDRLREATDIQKKICETGVNIELDEVLLRKGYLSPQQLASINAALGKGRTDLIKGYEIIGKIGQGGMGTVYKARQISVDRIVAIKVLLPSFSADKGAVDRFLREARVIAKLSHPHLVAGIDAGYQQGIYYCVMEFVQGETLAALLQKGKPFPWDKALAVIENVAAALAHAAQNGFVHRDVKPANIIVDGTGTAKLMDLGLAKLVGADGQNVSSGLTITGNVMGTPMYMSPEQVQGAKKIDIRSDIYSLGLTFYEMLCRQKPFAGQTAMAVMSQRLKETPRFDRLAEANVPDPVIAIVRKMTARDVEQRYASAEELIEDVRAVRRGAIPTHARAPRPVVRTARVVAVKPRSPAPWVLFGIAAAVLVGVALLAFFIGGQKKTPEPERHPDPQPIAVQEQPKPPDKTTPEPIRPPAVELPTEELEQYWKAALEYEEKNKDRGPEEILLNYLATRERLRGSLKIDDAERKVSEWTKRVEELVRAQKKKLQDSLDALLKDKKYGDALSLLETASGNFSNERLRQERDLSEYANWPTEIRTQRARVERDVTLRAQQIRSEAAEHRRNQRFDLAVQLYTELKGLGVEALSREAETELAAVETERSAHESELERKSRQEVALIGEQWRGACASASQRDYASAVKKLEDPAPQVTLPEQQRSLEELRSDLRLAWSVLQDVERAGKKVKEMTGVKIAECYRSARKTAEGTDQNKALLLFALHESDAVTADKEMPKLKSAQVTLRPEYEELYRKARARADEFEARTRRAEDLRKEADRKFQDPKTRDEAVRIYRELLESYADCLPQRILEAIQGKTWFKTDNDGFIRNWLLLGPLALDQRLPHTEAAEKPIFEKEFFAGQKQASPRPGTKVQIDGKDFTWTAHECPTYVADLTEFAKASRLNGTHALYLGVAYVICDQDMEVKLLIGSDDSSLWRINGHEVIHVYAGRGIAKDQDRSGLMVLRKGVNVLTMSVINGEGPGAACARFVDRADKPVKNIYVSLTPPVGLR